MKAIVVAAALGALGVAGLGVNPAVAAGLGQQHPEACASGYHADTDGNCQPNIAQYNRFCAPGLVYQPDPLGWFCAPPPPRDSY